MNSSFKLTSIQRNFFCSAAGLITAVAWQLLLAAPSQAQSRIDVKVFEAPPTTAANPFYITNRAPLLPAPLIKLPIGGIQPRGWLRHQLELEARGMIGHLEEISKWCKFGESAWA